MIQRKCSQLLPTEENRKIHETVVKPVNLLQCVADYSTPNPKFVAVSLNCSPKTAGTFSGSFCQCRE